MIYNHKKLNTTRTPEVINKISWKPECITQPSLFEFGLFGSMRSSTAWEVDEKYDFDQSEAGFHTVIHVLSLTLFPFPFALDYDGFRVYGYTSVPRWSSLKVPLKWLQSMKYYKYNSYLCRTMWNHAKNLMKKLKRPNSLFTRGNQLCGAKNM